MDIEVVATLIEFTDFPEILSTSAEALYPSVPSLSNINLSPILYSEPPEIMFIVSIEPGEAYLMFAVWFKRFGIFKYE